MRWLLLQMLQKSTLAADRPPAFSMSTKSSFICHFSSLCWVFLSAVVFSVLVCCFSWRAVSSIICGKFCFRESEWVISWRKYLIFESWQRPIPGKIQNHTIIANRQKTPNTRQTAAPNAAWRNKTDHDGGETTKQEEKAITVKEVSWTRGETPVD